MKENFTQESDDDQLKRQGTIERGRNCSGLHLAISFGALDTKHVKMMCETGGRLPNFWESLIK